MEGARRRVDGRRACGLVASGDSAVAPRARIEVANSCHPYAHFAGLNSVTGLVESTTDAEIYETLAPELTRFATTLVGRVDAPDVVSGAVVKALASPSWRAVVNHRAFLYRAVLNEATTLRRRAAMRRAREARVVARDRWELPTLRPDVQAAVTGLSVRQRAVIVLTYWDDLDPASIADRLGLSEGTVRRHLARARAKLREVLDA